jgi:hypothetical protein
MAAMGAASHNTGVSIMTNNTDNKPVKQFRIGLISAAVWRREAGGNTFYSVTIDRSYKDEDGNWQRTNSYDVGDLFIVQLLAEKTAPCLADLPLEA